MFCSKVVGQVFQYNAVAFSDGSLFVSCSVSGGAVASEYSAIFEPSQLGATTGGCAVTYDVDDPNGGYWAFTLSPLQAKYNDIGSASDQQVVSFSVSTDCIHQP
jgi:hypothetical protein